MNWLQRLFSKKGASFSFIPEWVRQSGTTNNFRKFVEDGYRINSAVAACTTTLAFSFPEPPLLTGYKQDNRFVQDYENPIFPLIQQPNPDMGEVEFMQYVITYAAIGGNCYIWKQRSAGNKVVGLYPFSDYNVTPIPGIDTSQGIVSHYEFDDGEGKKIPIPKQDVIHWKWMPDPMKPWRGIGAIEFAAREVDRDNEANAYIYSLLSNNAVPPVVITLTEGEELTEDKANRLRNQWLQKYGGYKRGGPAFLEAGMKAEKLGFSLQELAAEALNAVPEARIAAAFRVPPVVAGLSVGLKRSDYGDQAARRSFTELTLAALWRSLASEMLNGLRSDFSVKNNFALKFDIREVRALQEEESKLWERVTLAWDRGAITRKMMKEAIGIIPEEGDDVYKVWMSAELIPSGQITIREPESVMTPTEALNNDNVGADSGKQKSKIQPEEKTRSTVRRAVGKTLQRARLQVAGRMTGAVDRYFTQLSERVSARAQAFGGKSAKGALPESGDLLNEDDAQGLEAVVKKYYIEILQASWETWNLALGVELNFELTDPLVSEALKMAGANVREIHQTTLQQLQDALVYANEQGWGIDQLVRGDSENGIPGLRDLIEETYKDRARNIARTELGEAQNAATVSRYESAGVSLVEILDNGSTDDDDECKEANGQIWTLTYFSEHMLEHPSCTRAAAPYFGNNPPDRS